MTHLKTDSLDQPDCKLNPMDSLGEPPPVYLYPAARSSGPVHRRQDLRVLC